MERRGRNVEREREREDQRPLLCLLDGDNGGRGDRKRVAMYEVFSMYEEATVWPISWMRALKQRGHVDSGESVDVLCLIPGTNWELPLH